MGLLRDNAWYLDDGHVMGTKQEHNCYGKENTEASLSPGRPQCNPLQSPNLLSRAQWLGLEKLSTELDPLLRGIPKVLLELLPRRVLLY